MRELAKRYDDRGHVYWHCICPCCGQREAVLFGCECSRACRFCGAQWNEIIMLTRYVDIKTGHKLSESKISGVSHMPWPFSDMPYSNPAVEEEDTFDGNLGVFEKDGKLFVSSRTVAAAFEKNHKDVLRSIQNLDSSPEFNERNFTLVNYKDSKGEYRPEVHMTRDGFTFLAMGYTGKKAAQFKEAYINKFNEMEAALHKPEKPERQPLPIGSKRFWTPEEAAEELGIGGYRALYARMEGLGLIVKNKRSYEPAPDKRQFVGYRRFGTKKGNKYYRPVVLAAGMDYLRRELGA